MLPTVKILCGDAIEQLRPFPDKSVHCCVTSPPYWGLRDYGVKGQLGLERTPEEYVASMVEVFTEVRRVLRGDGTLWLNIGDSYTSGGRGEQSRISEGQKQATNRGSSGFRSWRPEQPFGLKPKDLVGIPWRLAFALQADGWWLRQDIIWHKPNPMPESVTDRCTKAHEYIFLLTKSARYFFDAEAIKEPVTGGAHPRKGYKTPDGWDTSRGNGGHGSFHRDGREKGHIPGVGPKSSPAGSGIKANESFQAAVTELVGSRNKRSVWTVATDPYSEAHFATFPPELIKPCILAGTSARGCCPKCGAPWHRLVEIDRVPMGDYSGKYAEEDYRGNNLRRSQDAGRRNGGDHDNPWSPPRTIGWKPSCHCQVGEPVPATVLDVFAGSFTTCATALELGRSSIGIELNPEYIALGAKRCDVTPGLALA